MSRSNLLLAFACVGRALQWAGHQDPREVWLPVREALMALEQMPPKAKEPSDWFESAKRTDWNGLRVELVEAIGHLHSGIVGDADGPAEAVRCLRKAHAELVGGER